MRDTIGGSDQDELFSIKQTTDNGYILGGWSSSTISVDKTEIQNRFNRLLDRQS